MSANDSNGLLFVEVRDKEGGVAWRRVHPERVRGRRIIVCSKCELPAVALDHYWPYYNDNTLCAVHWRECHEK